MRFSEFKVIGRKLPSDNEPEPSLYKMSIFAKNEVEAESKFWKFMNKLKKIKKTRGEIVLVERIPEKEPLRVKNFGVWFRYSTGTKTCNMYKEYRELTRADCARSCIGSAVVKHGAIKNTVQIIKMEEISDEDVKRASIKQLLVKNIKYPHPFKFNMNDVPKFSSVAPVERY